MADKSLSKNTDYITLLSVLAAIAVVFLHANGCFWQFSREAYWISADIMECLFYFAVPVFYMISGATLMDYPDRYSTKTFFVKRAQKTVIPFVAWSLIGLLYNVLTKSVYVKDITIKYVIKGVLTTSIIQIYWFFPVLFCIYLCMPLFASVPKEKRKSIFSYLAVAGFLLNVAIPFFMRIFSVQFSFPLSVSVVGGSLLYVIIGYLISEYEMPRKWEIVIYLAAVAGLLAHIIGTYTLSVSAGKIVDTYKGYSNLPCMLYSVGVFLFFKRFGNRLMQTKLRRPVMFFGKYTFGLYLVHYYFMMVLQRLLEKSIGLSDQSMLYRLGAPPIIIALSLLLIWCMRKIPFVRKIVP